MFFVSKNKAATSVLLLTGAPTTPDAQVYLSVWLD